MLFGKTGQILAQLFQLLGAFPVELHRLFGFQHLLDAVGKVMAEAVSAFGDQAGQEPDGDHQRKDDAEYTEGERSAKLRNGRGVHLAANP